MARKNFDLSSFQTNNSTEQSQDRCKYSAFIENEDSKTPETYTTKVAESIELREPKNSVPEEKRINMAFTDSNYDFIIAETDKLGINCMHFINSIISSTDSGEIDQCIEKQPLRKGKHSAPRRKGHPMKRINFKLDGENYNKVFECAERNDTTITTIVNVVIEIYRDKRR